MTSTIPATSHAELRDHTTVFDLAAELPDLLVSEARRFCHKTRLADSWAAQTETVLLPAHTISSNAHVIVTRSASIWRPDHAWRRFNNRKTLDLGDKLFFDTRLDHQSNPAHVLHWMWLRVAYASRVLHQHEFSSQRPAILLRGDSSAIARTAWALLGYETIETDRPVTGLQLAVKTSPTTSFAGLLPEFIAGLKCDLTSQPRKVYVARRNSRHVLNEDALLPHLTRRGFSRVFMEDLPLLDQWKLVATADELVGVHGAGLAPVIFRASADGKPQPHRYLIELHGPGYIVDLYRNFAAATRTGWCAVRGKVTSAVVRDLDELDQPRARETEPFTIDPDTLDQAFEWVTGQGMCQ